MKSFRELLRIGRHATPREDQLFVSRQLPSAVAKSNLHWWQLRAGAPSRGTRLLIGVAPYSAYDLKFLDLLNRAVARAPQGAIRVDVFNTLDCKSTEDFNAIIPGIGQVFQTPVVGLWADETLKERGSGKIGRDLAGKVLGIPQDEIEQQLSAEVPRFDLSVEALARRVVDAVHQRLPKNVVTRRNSYSIVAELRDRPSRRLTVAKIVVSSGQDRAEGVYVLVRSDNETSLADPARATWPPGARTRFAKYFKEMSAHEPLRPHPRYNIPFRYFAVPRNATQQNLEEIAHFLAACVAVVSKG
jgi:hypothetical protein